MHFECTFDVVRVWPRRRSEAREMSRRRESREPRESKRIKENQGLYNVEILSRSDRCGTQKLPRQQETAPVLRTQISFRESLEQDYLAIGRGSAPRPYLQRSYDNNINVRGIICSVQYTATRRRREKIEGGPKGETKGIVTTSSASRLDS